MNKELIKKEKSNMNIRGDIDIIEKSEGHRIIAGYASVAIIDKENQFIPIETLKQGISSLLADPSYANLMLIHKNIQIGKIVKGFGKYTTHVDEKGFYIVAEIRKDIKVADEVWDSILKKEFTGFSIGCEVLSSHDECDKNGCVNILDKINIFEVSVCNQPVNNKSGFVIISKSKLSNSNVCYECNIEKEDMVENKDKAQPCAEEKPVEPQKPVETTEEKLASLERQILALETRIQQEAEKPMPPIPPVPPVEQPPAEKPAEPEAKPEEKKPQEWSYEENMAIFMLGYIINNPKSSAQDIAKAWIEEKNKSKAKPLEEKPEDKPIPPIPPAAPPYPDEQKKGMEELKKAILSLVADKKREEEFNLALKSRDDLISSLKKKVEIVTKGEIQPPKTVQTPQTEVTTVEESSLVVSDGNVYFKD